jgi:hypothetical protein
MIIPLGPVNEDEPIGLSVGQGPQQNAVDHAEESRVRSYPESQSSHGDEREGGLTDEDPHSMA